MNQDESTEGPVGEWLAEVAKRSGQPLDVVREILTSHGVRARTTLPRPHRILVTEVFFDGLRPVPGDETATQLKEFSFSWALDSGVWCVASLGKNEAGKSSILEIILWCLRGRSGLQADVRNWLRHVRVRFALDDEHLSVEMTVVNGLPQGEVIALDTDTVLAQFNGLKNFEQVMDAFMLDRLNLEPLRTAQDARKGADIAPITGELSWPAYASALHINRASLTAVLGGGSVEHGLPVRLLELFLGAPWASTKVAAQVAHKVVAANLMAAQARAASDAAARQTQLAELTQRLLSARDRLQALPQTTQAAATLQELYAALTTATQEAAQAQGDLARARGEHDEQERHRQSLVVAVHAAEEAALARAFFHTLTPTVCPRCDTAVRTEQWEREKDGTCSLCASDLHPSHEAAAASASHTDGHEDDPDALSEIDDLRLALASAQEAVEEIAARLARAQRTAAQTAARREDAASRLQAATDAPAAAVRHEAELDVARLEGALAERQGRFDDLGTPVDVAPLTRAAAVLKAAEATAHERRTTALKQILDDINRDITAMGRDLGLDMLERAELTSGAQLTVWKGGGQKQNYGSLTEGEQLRLKIVTTIALLRHGFRSGVGRHPGLLLVDSPGAEEVDSGDLRHMLEDLVRLTQSNPELQVIIATARGADAQEVIPAGRMLLAGPGQRLW
ncbi:hypothetical protein AB0D67_32485 [Streptosporangium sp. NPDC048047]|uniref:hypothetical protein n=1 Tax=Streptosporangium sp. NPDC048047 TaxID=3155748 RepID=UPI0034495641